jgi:hypothetical protein
MKIKVGKKEHAARKTYKIKTKHKKEILEQYVRLVMLGWSIESIRKEFTGPDGYGITSSEFSEIIKNRG